MKVVQVNSVCGRGSTGKICVAVSQLMTQSGIENYILYSRWHSDYESAIKFESDRYAKYQAFREKLFGTYGFEAKKPTKKLLRYLDYIQPDIVHLHVLHSHDINLEMLFGYLREKNIKVFWTFHDCWAITGYCPMFDMIGCDKWRTSCNHCPERKSYSWLFDKSQELQERKKKMVEGLDLTIITPSQWLAGVVKQSFFKQFQVKVIHNGIDLNVFRPYSIQDAEYVRIMQLYGLEHKKVLLGVADIWNEHKGFSDYIRLADFMGEEFQIVLVGLTDSQIKSLPKSILGILRTLNQTELAVWYSIANAVLNLTYEDTFPTINLEAMACGTPVITYNTGGSPEAITDKTGWVLDRGDVKGVAAIVATLDHKSAETRASCRKKAEDCFGQSRCFKHYLSLYQR